MMFWYGNGMSGWGYVLMTVSLVLFWGLIIAGIVALIRYFGRVQPSGAPPPQRPTPEQVLADRLARGEVNEEEYQRRLDLLHHGQASGR